MVPLLVTAQTTVLPPSTSGLNCTLQVPALPLTPQGLATPYILAGDGCTMKNIDQSGAFVHAAIVDLDTGAISVYNPLVIDQGTTPLYTPVPPKLPALYIMGIWMGFNGNNLTLVPTWTRTNSLVDGNCINGGGLRIMCAFGQFAYCNAPAFYDAVNDFITSGKVIVPPLGKAIDGELCPTVRDWMLVDQSPSDNVPVQYIIDQSTGRVAQDTKHNRALASQDGYTIGVGVSGDDSGLLGDYVGPALGCESSSWLVPDLADNGTLVSSNALNEIQASMYAPLPMPRVPSYSFSTFNDMPGLRWDQRPDVHKLNSFRAGVNQVPILTLQDANSSYYCTHMIKTGATRIYNNRQTFQAMNDAQTIDALGGSLYEHLIFRFAVTMLPVPIGLNCTEEYMNSMPTNVASDLINIFEATNFYSWNVNNSEWTQNIQPGINISTPATKQLITWFENTLIPSVPSIPDPPAGRLDYVRETVSYRYVDNTGSDGWTYDVGSFFIGFGVALVLGIITALIYWKCMKDRSGSRHSHEFSDVSTGSNHSTSSPLAGEKKPYIGGTTVEMEPTAYNVA